MPRCPELEAWAAPLVDAHAVVLHLASGRVGKVQRLYLPGEFIGAGGLAIGEHVIELATGDRFLVPEDAEAREAMFAVLAPVEVQFLDATAGELSKTIQRAVGAALVTRDGPFPITAESALRLIVVALQGQMRALHEAAQEGIDE